MKDSDAKLKGLMFAQQCQPVTEHDSCDLCPPKEGPIVLKSKFMKMKYYWHLFQQRHHELLLKECISEELKTKLKIKALYHQSKVLELFYKMECSV